MPTDLKEFDDLIAALQDERPQIDPGFARELDTRAAAGFPKPGRRRLFTLPRFSLMVGAPAAAFSVLIALVVVAALAAAAPTTRTPAAAALVAAVERGAASRQARTSCHEPEVPARAVPWPTPPARPLRSPARMRRSTDAARLPAPPRSARAAAGACRS